MRPGSLQQALAGLAVVLVIAATLLGGIILALGDTARSRGVDLAERAPTATLYRLSTAPPVTGPLDTHTPVPTVVIIPTQDRTATPSAIISATPTPTRTLIPTIAFPTSHSATLPKTPTPAPTETPVPTSGPTGTQTATDGACTNPDSIITSPRVGAVLSGLVAFYGTARVPDFSFYKLEIRREGASTSSGFVTFYTGTEQIQHGVLATLDTLAWADGEYWIRLVVVDSTGNYPERCAILYVFDN